MALIGIVSGNRHRAQEFLHKLVGKIPLGDVDGVQNSRQRGLEIFLKNGDVYRAYWIKGDYVDHLRGLWFKKLYVDDELKGEEFLYYLMSHCDMEVDYFVL